MCQNRFPRPPLNLYGNKFNVGEGLPSIAV